MYFNCFLIRVYQTYQSGERKKIYMKKQHNILHYLVPEIRSLKQCKNLFKNKKQQPQKQKT